MREMIMTALLCLIVASCGKGGQSDPQEQARRDSLSAVDDSIRQLSPHALTLVEQHLKAATDSTAYYEYLARKATYYLYSAHPDSMFPYAEAVMRYAEAQNPPTPRINTLRAHAYEAQAAYRQNRHTDVDRIEYWRNKALAALIESDSKDLLPDMMANMADSYVLVNDLPRAAAAYRRALFLADSLKLPEEKSITLYMGLASIYLNLGDYQETHRLYDKCYKYRDRLSPKMQVMLVNNFGNYFYYRGQYREALEKFLELKRIVRKHESDDSFSMNLCNINLSDVYLNLDSLNRAEQCLNVAEPFFRNHAIAVGIYYANTIRMGIAVKRKQFAKVPEILAAEHISETIDHSMETIRNQYLRQYYLATGNARAAFDNKMREDRIEDSLAEKRNFMRASEVIQRFSEDTLALHHKIAIGEKQQETRQAQSVAVALVGCVIILLLVLAFWWQRSRRRRTEGEIALLKQRMENARNRMSPHFVFNILNHRMVNTSEEERDELMTLAKLIRRSLDLSHNASTPLDEELRFVADYVDLQRYVLRPDFDFRIDTPDDAQLMEQTQVPSMFVQILVENAIKHGLKGLDRPQSIHITITDDGQATTITVCDNGRGFGTGGAARKGTGLSTMFQTIDTLNTHNKRHPMDIDIHNSRDEQGHVTGCRATLTIPHNYQYS